MSWQQYVDEQLISGGYLTGGAIIGHNGIVWASNNIALKHEEIDKLISGFADSKAVMNGTILLNGGRYIPVKANANSIYGNFLLYVHIIANKNNVKGKFELVSCSYYFQVNKGQAG
jgi:hypothetical protein